MPMPTPWHVVLYLMYLMCNCVYIFLYAIFSLCLFLSLSHLSRLLVPPLLVLLVLPSLSSLSSSPSPALPPPCHQCTMPIRRLPSPSLPTMCHVHSHKRAKPCPHSLHFRA